MRALLFLVLFIPAAPVVAAAGAAFALAAFCGVLTLAAGMSGDGWSLDLFRIALATFFA